MKVCTKCKQIKGDFDFGKCTKKSDGLKEVCKECRRKEAKEYYVKKDKQKHILETLKARAKKLNVPFDLEYEDLTPPEICPVFGFKLERVDPHSNKSSHYSPSIDRIDPTKGYTKDNIQIISNLANIMKHNASKEQLIMFAEWVFKNYKEK